jgi:hypothetical protein
VLEIRRSFPQSDKKKNLGIIEIPRFSVVEISGIEPLTS